MGQDLPRCGRLKPRQLAMSLKLIAIDFSQCPGRGEEIACSSRTQKSVEGIECGMVCRVLGYYLVGGNYPSTLFHFWGHSECDYKRQQTPERRSLLPCGSGLQDISRLRATDQNTVG